MLALSQKLGTSKQTMLISDTFILQLNLLASIVLFTIALGLFFRKNNVKANVFLALLLLYPAVSIPLNMVFIIYRQYHFIFLSPVITGFNLTFGSILLSYLKLIQGRQDKFNLKKALHFIPAIFILISAVYYLLLSPQQQATSLNKLLAGEEEYINFINLFLLLHICCYLYLGWKSVKNYEKQAIELNAVEASVSIRWQKALLKCILTVNISLTLAYLLPIIITGHTHIYADLIATPLAALVMYIFIIYKGLSYHVIYNQPNYDRFAIAVAPLNQFIETTEILEKQAKEAPSFDNDFINQIKPKLEQLFTIEKLHTQPVLKLHEVATALSISPSTLSVFINNHLKMSFFEMLNRYRVEEAKQLLVNPNYQHYKIEYIGEISGFNSRASFFSVFKKHVGKTPQAFRDEHLSSNN